MEKYKNIVNPLLETGIQKVPEAIVIPITSVELYNLWNTNSLNVGHWYKITDYETIYNQTYTDAVKNGGVEVILVLATGTNKISKNIGYSITHTTDLIHFDISNRLCRDGVTSRPGIITYRKNVERNVECDFDFRVVLHSVKPMDIAESWVSGSDYFSNTLLKYNGTFYIVKDSITNSTTTPDNDRVYFYRMNINVGDLVNFGDEIIGCAKDFNYTTDTTQTPKEFNTFPDYFGNDEDTGDYYTNISISGGKVNDEYSSNIIINVTGAKFTDPDVDDIIIRNCNTMFLRSTTVRGGELRNCEHIDINGDGSRVEKFEVYSSRKINTTNVLNSKLSTILGMATGSITNSDLAEVIGTILSFDSVEVGNLMLGNFGSVNTCVFNRISGNFPGNLSQIVSHGEITNFEIESTNTIQNIIFEGRVNFWGTDMTIATKIFENRQKTIYKYGNSITDLSLNMFNEDELLIYDVNE